MMLLLILPILGLTLGVASLFALAAVHAIV